MKQRLKLLKLVGAEANVFGFAPLPKAFLEANGIPADVVASRRYRDVAYGVPSVAIVLEHPTFAEVEQGGQIPEYKAIIAPAPVAPAPAVPEKAVEPVKEAQAKGKRK